MKKSKGGWKYQIGDKVKILSVLDKDSGSLAKYMGEYAFYGEGIVIGYYNLGYNVKLTKIIINVNDRVNFNVVGVAHQYNADYVEKTPKNRKILAKAYRMAGKVYPNFIFR